MMQLLHLQSYEIDTAVFKSTASIAKHSKHFTITMAFQVELVTVAVPHHPFPPLLACLEFLFLL